MTTQRTITQVLALLADNTTADISPEDMRDLVETFRPRSAELYFSTPANTAVATVSTPLKVAGTTTLVTSPAAVGFTMPENNRLTYGGTAKICACIQGHVSITATGNGKVFNFYIAKNGTVLVQSQIRRKIGTGTDVGAMGFGAILEMVATDYIELWVENITDDTDVQAEVGSYEIMTWPANA